MKSNSRVLRGWRDFGVKATAIILTILLATQMVGTPAFASGALTNKQASEDIATTVDDTGVEPSGTEATDTTVPDEAAGAANEPAPADSTQATEEPVVETVESATEPATETPAADPAANTVLGTEPEPTADSGSEPAPAVEQDQLASIKLNLADGASITLSKDGNKIDDDTNPVDVPANEELKFTAQAAEGWQVDKVKTVIDGVETELTADANGEYKIAADKVTDKLTVKVEMSAVEGENGGVSETGNDEKATEGRLANGNAMNAAMLLAVEGNVSVKLRLYNSNNAVAEILDYSLSSGNIDDNAPSADSVSGLAGYYFDNASVSSSQDEPGTQIAYAGLQNGSTYYAFVENPTYGVMLDKGETIYLNYMLSGNTVPVTTETNGADKVTGNSVNAADRATKGQDFSFTVSTARGYEATVTVNGEPLTSESGTYTYPVPEDADDVVIVVSFAAVETVTFDPGVFNQRNYKYLYEGGSEDTYGAQGGTNGSPRFTSSTLNEQTKQLGEDGATFEFIFTTRGDWQCDSMQLNYTYISVPQTRTVSSGEPTVLYSDDSGECVATLELTGISGENATYKLTVTGAKEDIVITAANLNGGGWSEVIPTATEGIWFQSSASEYGSLEDGGLNEPYATDGGGTPKFRFGLENGYKNLAISLVGYTDDDETAYNSEVELPQVGQTKHVTVTYRYWGWGGWHTENATVATITASQDGSYTIQFRDNSEYDGRVTLQFMELSCELETYAVSYDDGGGSGAPTDVTTYDVVNNSTVVVANGLPTPPDDKQFSGWKIVGDNSGTLYQAGDAISLNDDSINALIDRDNAGANDGVLRLEAQYVNSLEYGQPVSVPVYTEIQQSDGTYTRIESSAIGGITGKTSVLNDYEPSIERDDIE